MASTKRRRSNGSGRSSRSSGNLLDQLKRDHREVKSLLSKMMKSEDPEERTELFDQFKPALVAHSKAEEEMFYPLLRESDEEEARTDSIESYVEHGIVEQLLQELDGLKDTESEEWTARCKVLNDLVSHHVKEEESTIFKDARKVLGNARLKELLPEFEATKEKHMSA